MREVARAIGLSGIDPGRLAEVMPLLAHGRWRSHATSNAAQRWPDCDWLVANVDQHGRKVEEVPIADA
jgi:hypothetical protein